MNLRGYLGKQLNTSEYGKSEDLPWPYVSIPIKLGDGTYEHPTYSLFIQLAPGDVVISIERLVNHCTGRFPEDIEDMAEAKLQSITAGKAHLVSKCLIDANNLSKYLTNRFSRFGLSEDILRYGDISKIDDGYKYYFKDENREISAIISINPATKKIAVVCVKTSDNKLLITQAEKIVNHISFNRIYVG